VFKGSLDLFARGSRSTCRRVLFLALALSLFGMFELRLPGFVIDRRRRRAARAD